MDDLPNKFQHKIYRAVSQCKTGALKWSDEGDSIIFNFPQFKMEYLDADDSISRSSSISSFIRQLNLYGFRKLVDLTHENNYSEYANMYFRRGKPELLDFITRNNTQPKFMKNLMVKKEVLSDEENTNISRTELSKLKTSVESRNSSSLKRTLDNEEKEKFDPRASLADIVKTRKRKCVLKSATGFQREEQKEQIHDGDGVSKKSNKPIVVKSVFNMQHKPVILKNGDKFPKKAQQTALDMQCKPPVLNQPKSGSPVQQKKLFLKRNGAPGITEGSVFDLQHKPSVIKGNKNTAKPSTQTGNTFMILKQPATKQEKHYVLNGYNIPLIAGNQTIYPQNESGSQDVIYIGKFQSSVPKPRQNSNIVIVKPEPEEGLQPEFQKSHLAQALNSSRTSLSKVNSHNAEVTQKNTEVNSYNYSSNLKSKTALEDVKYIGTAWNSSRTSLSNVNSHKAEITQKNPEVNTYNYSSNCKSETILEDVKYIGTYQNSALVHPVLAKMIIKQEPKDHQAGKVLHGTCIQNISSARTWHNQPHEAEAEKSLELDRNSKENLMQYHSKIPIIKSSANITPRTQASSLQNGDENGTASNGEKQNIIFLNTKVTPNSVPGKANTRSPLLGEKSPTGLKWLPIKEEKDSVPLNTPCTETPDCKKRKLTILQGTPVKPNIISKASKRLIVKNMAEEFSATDVVSNKLSLKENDSSENAVSQDDLTLMKRNDTRKRKPNDEESYMYDENPLMHDDDLIDQKVSVSVNKKKNFHQANVPKKPDSTVPTITCCGMDGVIHRHDNEYSENFHDVFTDWYKPNIMLAQAFYEHLQDNF